MSYRLDCNKNATGLDCNDDETAQLFCEGEPMKCVPSDRHGRYLVVSEIPQLYRAAPDILEIMVSYTGESSGCKAIPLDNQINPAIVWGLNRVDLQPLAAEHVATLDGLIDGRRDQLGELLQPIRDYLEQLAVAPG